MSTPRTDALVTKETYPHATQEAFCKCLDNLDRLESLSRDLERENAAQAATIAELRAEVEALRVDVERYRYVRTQVASIGRFRMAGNYIDEETKTEMEFEWWRGPASDAFDEWVDKARKESAK